MMKKSLLALAVAALSANAFAVNLDTKAGTDVFAKEIKVASAGTAIGGTALVAEVKAGFALNSGFVRFDLDNGAKFGDTTNPSLLVTDGAATPTNKFGGGSTTGQATVVAGGAGSSYVIFKLEGLTASPSTILATDVVKLTTATGIKVVNKQAVNVSFGLYETASNAAAQTGNLNPNKSGALLNFADALNIYASANTAKRSIDAISSASKLFATTSTPTDNTALVDLKVELNAKYGASSNAAPLKVDGSGAVALTDIFGSTSEWNVSGNFSAVKAAGLTSTSAATTTIATDKQSVKFVVAAANLGTQTISYAVTGTDEIAETNISAALTPNLNAAYEVAAVTLNNITKLEKNGTTRSVDLALKPGGAFSNFVRISNKDTISGAFFLKVINDNGQSVTFPLSDVAGQPATLAAGASTTQMSIQSIFDTATAKGLSLSGEGKLRLEVTGQTNNLSVQSYTVSKDGNSFATF